MNRSTIAVIVCWIAAIALFLFIGFMQSIDAEAMAQLQAQMASVK